MTKFEAIQAMKAGHKVRHRWFSSDEWVKLRSDGRFEFEDGVICSPGLFWMDRTNSSWNDGWEIVKE